LAFDNWQLAIGNGSAILAGDLLSGCYGRLFGQMHCYAAGQIESIAHRA
jgi:hypothetical protein